MKKGKLIAFLITACIIITALPMNTIAAPALNVGDVLGYVINTDIKVYIDGYQIPSYSVNDKMVIKMDDLLYYGFDVIYDNQARELRAYRNLGKERDLIIKIEKSTFEAGSILAPYVYTDIKTFIDNKEIPGFAMNGNIYIYVDDLGLYGDFTWNGNEQSLKLVLSDMSDKTPTKFDLQNASLNVLSTNYNFYVTGFSVKFTGTYYYLNPDDFTDIILTKNGKRVDNAVISYEPSQLKIENKTTSAIFLLEENITEPGYYGISGKYKDMPFNSKKIIENRIGNTPANVDDLKKVYITTKTDDNRKTKILSNEIGFYFDGRQEAFDIADLTDLKLVVDGQKINFTLKKDDLKRLLTYSEETDTFTTFYYINLDDYTMAYGKYILFGKYMGKEFESNSINVMTASKKTPASIVFSAESNGVLTGNDVAYQLYINGLTNRNYFVANFDTSVKKIDKYAFSNCSGLIELNISANINEINSIVFAGCDNLETINVHKDNKHFTVSDSVLFTKDKTVLILYPATGKGAYVIPEGVLKFQNHTFYNCYNLTKIEFPQSLNYISGHAFNGCIGLKELLIPSNITSIGFGAFAGCTNLKTVTFKGKFPPVIYDEVFPDIPNVYVPRASLSIYQDVIKTAIPNAVLAAFD